MQDKIALLMEETGCDRGQAELALEQCGYRVEEAVKAISKLLRDIVVLKGRFRQSDQHRFGLLLMVLNSKTRALLRTRAVVSYNPEAYAVSLDKSWFEFEKYLYGCRLWDGSLQDESQRVEQALTRRFRDPGGLIERVEDGHSGGAHGWLSGILKTSLESSDFQLTLKKEILDLRQFQSLQMSHDSGARPRTKESRPPLRKEAPLTLKIALDEEEGGVPAGSLRAGDVVSARVTDSRDIGRYLARLLGGAPAQGPAPIAARVEAIEADAENLLVRVRFAPGVCGDASLPRNANLKVLDQSQAHEEASWWKRLFP